MVAKGVRGAYMLPIHRPACTGHLLRHVNIRREFNSLLHQLRFHLGNEFLQSARFIVANNIMQNLFLRVYPQSFVALGAPPLPTDGRGEGTS